MADSTSAAVPVASAPSSADLQRAEDFTREPFLHEGEEPEEALAPSTARRRALDAALAELDAGAEQPSVAWRQQYSLLLGLERLLSEEEPHLADGTVLTAHQVDALSGTLIALTAEAQRVGRRTATARGRSNGEPAELASSAIPGEEEIDEAEGEPDEEPQDWDEELPRTRTLAARRAARGPQRRPALLVRARHRRRARRSRRSASSRPRAPAAS